MQKNFLIIEDNSLLKDIIIENVTKYFKSKINQKYMQNFYDYVFRQIELDIREIGYGDQTVNKKMKTYVNLLYSIINKFENWEKSNFDEKNTVLKSFIKMNDNNENFVDYFIKYTKYLSKTSLNSFTKSVINHKF